MDIKGVCQRFGVELECGRKKLYRMLKKYVKLNRGPDKNKISQPYKEGSRIGIKIAALFLRSTPSLKPGGSRFFKVIAKSSKEISSSSLS